MSNGNEPATSPPQPKEVCTIRVMFPITSDEQGIEYKKKVSAILSDISDAHIEFSIRTMPNRASLNIPTSL